MDNKTLIKNLQAMPADAEVFLSSDPEGNSFRPLDEVEHGLFNITNREAVHPDDAAPDTPKAVIIWPG